MEMVRKYLLVLGFAGVGLTGCKQHPTGSSQVVAGAVAPGEIRSQLPVFDVKDLQGRDISSAELRGKVEPIEFSATWCQPSTKERPGSQKLLELYRRREL